MPGNTNLGKWNALSSGPGPNRKHEFSGPAKTGKPVSAGSAADPDAADYATWRLIQTE